MSDTAITMYSGDVQESVGLVGAAPATAVVNTRSNIQALSFRALAREQLPQLLSLARRLVGEDAEDRLFPGLQTTSPLGRRCFGRMGVPASPTRSVWAGLGLALRAPWRSGMARSRTTMRTHPTTTNGTRTLDAGVHHGEGRAGFWEPL